MKNNKILSLLVFILVVTIVPTTVFAKEAIDVNSEETLRSCISETGNVCKLRDDVKLSATVDIANNITLDLNGKKIVNNGVTDTTGLLIVLPGGTLTVNDAVGTGVIDGGNTLYAGIQVTKKNYSTEQTTTLVVNGGTIQGYYYGIVGHGSRHNTNITINGGTIKGLNDEDCEGIYHPQNGVMTINGGTIQGSTGLEMRAGILTVNGGTITGTYIPTDVTANGSGTTTKGAGIAIAQHTTKLDTKVVINKGTIQGFTALYESNPQNNDAASIAKVSIEVNGGNFKAINGGTNVAYSKDKTEFVKGGTFNINLTSSLIATGFVSKQIGTTYTVGKNNDITIVPVTNGTITSNMDKAFAGESVTLTPTPAKDYELASIIVTDGNGTEIAVNENSFVMPSSNVTITATFKKIEQTVEIPTVKPTDKVEEVTVAVPSDSNVGDVLLDSLNNSDLFTNVVDKTSVKVNVEVNQIKNEDIDQKVLDTIKEKNDKLTVSEFFDITIAVKNANTNTELGTLTELSDEIELMILLPDYLKNTKTDINRVYYIVREHDGKVEILPAKLSADGNSLVFKSKLFSTYALAYEDKEVDNNVTEDDVVVEPTTNKTVQEANPETLDNILFYVLLGGLSMIGLAGAGLSLKNKRFN